MVKEGEKLKADGVKQLDDYRDCVEGETAFIYSVEGCDLLDGSVSLLAAWRGMGVRMAALTWNYENCIGVPACCAAGLPFLLPRFMRSLPQPHRRSAESTVPGGRLCGCQLLPGVSEPKQ